MPAGRAGRGRRRRTVPADRHPAGLSGRPRRRAGAGQGRLPCLSRVRLRDGRPAAARAGLEQAGRAAIRCCARCSAPTARSACSTTCRPIESRSRIYAATADAQAILQQRREARSHRVFDPERWPLFEINAIQLDDRVRLSIGVDLLIADAAALITLFREWGAFYREPGQNLPPLAGRFADHARRLPQPTPRERAYWEARLDTLPPGPDLPRLPLSQPPRFVRRSLKLEAPRWRELKQAARAQGLTPSALVAAIYADVLAAWNRRTHFSLILTQFAAPEGMQGVVGDFTSTILLEVDAAPPQLPRARTSGAKAAAHRSRSRDDERRRGAARAAPPPAGCRAGVGRIHFGARPSGSRSRCALTAGVAWRNGFRHHADAASRDGSSRLRGRRRAGRELGCGRGPFPGGRRRRDGAGVWRAAASAGVWNRLGPRRGRRARPACAAGTGGHARAATRGVRASGSGQRREAPR